MAHIFNLTQHEPADQQNDVMPRTAAQADVIKSLLLFKAAPGPQEIRERAKELAALAKASGAKRAMVGGAPYLMGPLEKELRFNRIEPVFSYSERSSVERTKLDGSVEKVSEFRHVGWVTSATI